MTAPKVFISYSHESEEHRAAVLQLAQRLRHDGIDVRLDRFIQAPAQGWIRWMMTQLAEADFVLMVCTAAYCSRFTGAVLPDPDKGANFEGLLITQRLYEASATNTHFVPVLLESASALDIPVVLRPFAHYHLMGEYEALYRHLTTQPEVEPEPLGPLPAARRYLEWLKTQPSGLDLVGGGDVSLELDEVYVPLRISSQGEVACDPPGPGGCDEFELTDLFAQLGGRPHALLLGRPGSGKTTALRKLVQRCVREGSPSLHLAPNTLPAFLRVRQFTAEDLNHPLANFVIRELREVSGGALDDATLSEVWVHGRLLLLLDGLDELVEEDLQARLCGYLAMQLASNDCHEVRVVIASRYSGQGGHLLSLDHTFTRCEVRPLDAGQVRGLIRRWFAEASKALPKFSLEQASRQAEQLITALSESHFGQRLQVMFSNPLLLTLMCVIVQQGRELPRHRAAFYGECLRVLLLRWRRAKGLDPLLDVDTAIALLRPLAYRLHAAGQREALAEDELVEHIFVRLAELGRGSVDPLRVLAWLHRETGVFTEFAPNAYGFFHLGIQEYLTALHIASGGEQALGDLTENFDKPWWHEVALLLVSMPAGGMFAPLMRTLLAGPALMQQTAILRLCVLEAAEVDVGPFVARLERSGAPEPPERQVELLRLLLGCRDPALLACVHRLEHARDPEVRGMAERVLASAARPAARDVLAFDVVLIAGAEDMSSATELAQRLRGRGLRVWPGEGPPEPATALSLRRIWPNVRVAVLLVGAASPWAERQAMLRMFQKTRKALGVRLPGAAALGDASEAIHQWVDLRGGWQSEPLAALCRQILPMTTREPVSGQVWIEPTTGMRFVFVPAGSFQMGCEYGAECERPVHPARLSAFWLGETPVTNQQYARFIEARKHREPMYWRDERFSDPQQPVIGVDWDDARAFCAWLAATARVAATLPSEAQWEYAARGTDSRTYPWGNEPPDVTRACFDQSGVDRPAVVGSYPAGRGPFGALDQAGNVWEWCEDVWDERAYEHASTATDPVNNEGDPETRAMRCGGWRSDTRWLASASRCGYWSWDRDVGGFRVAIIPSPAGP
ncbi:SUMF1/EgtB/PvdO family nonheme iron enzyme [Nannocystis radixulma]|uniref:SUMF1/EgtB/PvdO family nonheme iron enzyme n=1 Tax=Nannocystis radixulma TaxID=2995305 RepID=A0ABT5B9Q6_9BACT|nr:SUMF1/EgtB/PvdO family nonheme iron enzyme [Nannocystis radixulma]MDC0669741.1 SUMF1/EgtB/PvdO family nonheme iron enzyme [Nannocystis radixulma]